MTEITTLTIEGMTCKMCVKHVTHALQAVEGVSEVSVSLEDASAQLTYDPTAAGMAQFTEAVAEAGYKVVA